MGCFSLIHDLLLGHRCSYLSILEVFFHSAPSRPGIQKLSDLPAETAFVLTMRWCSAGCMHTFKRKDSSKSKRSIRHYSHGWACNQYLILYYIPTNMKFSLISKLWERFCHESWIRLLMFSAWGDIDFGHCLCLRNSGIKGDCCITHPVCFSTHNFPMMLLQFFLPLTEGRRL